ncbi:hypothetical protein SDJN03_12090, partial [Cucurbita argyrosperma subsp. sororia]
MNPVRYIVELEQPSEDTGIFDSREKNGMEMDGSGTSSWNYRRNALYNGECSISYSQSRAWPAEAHRPASPVLGAGVVADVLLTKE